MTNIFVLKIKQIKSVLDEKGEKWLPISYPFETWEEVVGYFSSLQKAESAMIDFIVLKRKPYLRVEIHSFTIMEYVVDDEDNEYSIAPSETRRSYLSDGKLEETCLISERGCKDERGKFWGRKPEEIRFKEGDIVELTHGIDFVPCIVAGLPATVEEFQKRSDEVFQTTGIRRWFYGDYSDDYYLLIPYIRDGDIVTVNDIVDPKTSPFPYDVEANSFNIFPPSISVTNVIKETLQTLHHVFKTERMERFEKWKEEGFK
jgi:hypothetical protein